MVYLINWRSHFFQYSASYGPEYGRLNKPTSYIAQTVNKGQWVQVDFGKVAKVTKIGTQGRYAVNQYITKYTVSYSIDGGFFEFQLHKPYSVPRVSYKSGLVLVFFLSKYKTSQNLTIKESPTDRFNLEIYFFNSLRPLKIYLFKTVLYCTATKMKFGMLF